MKFGLRRPSLRGRIAARTSWKRAVRHRLGLKAPRGYGWLTNPRKALYNRVYYRTTVDPLKLLFGGGRRRRARPGAGGGVGALLLLLAVGVVGVLARSPSGAPPPGAGPTATVPPPRVRPRQAADPAPRATAEPLQRPRQPVPDPDVRMPPTAREREPAPGVGAPPAPGGEGGAARLGQAVEAARAACLERLYATPEYRNAEGEAARLEEEVRALRPQRNSYALSAASQQWIAAKSRLGTMRTEALRRDAAVVAAEKALRERKKG